MFGYDSFVLEDDLYGDSFYSNMIDSVQIKKNTPPAQPAQPVQPTQPTVSSFVPRRSINEYAYIREIEKLQFQIIIFFILLIAAVIIIVTQRLTINTLQQLMQFIKPEMKLGSI